MGVFWVQASGFRRQVQTSRFSALRSQKKVALAPLPAQRAAATLQCRDFSEPGLS